MKAGGACGRKGRLLKGRLLKGRLLTRAPLWTRGCVDWSELLPHVGDIASGRYGLWNVCIVAVRGAVRLGAGIRDQLSQTKKRRRIYFGLELRVDQQLNSSRGARLTVVAKDVAGAGVGAATPAVARVVAGAYPGTQS